MATPLGDDRSLSKTLSGGVALAIGEANTAVISNVASATKPRTDRMAYTAFHVVRQRARRTLMESTRHSRGRVNADVQLRVR